MWIQMRCIELLIWVFAMVLIIDEVDVDTICNNIKGSYVIGRVIEGKKGVSLI